MVIDETTFVRICHRPFFLSITLYGSFRGLEGHLYSACYTGVLPIICYVYRLLTMIEDIFKISVHIRYVAIYRDGQLEKNSKSSTIGTSSPESDQYKELLVNPTLL